MAEGVTELPIWHFHETNARKSALTEYPMPRVPLKLNKIRLIIRVKFLIKNWLYKFSIPFPTRCRSWPLLFFSFFPSPFPFPPLVEGEHSSIVTQFSSTHASHLSCCFCLVLTRWLFCVVASFQSRWRWAARFCHFYWSLLFWEARQLLVSVGFQNSCGLVVTSTVFSVIIFRNLLCKTTNNGVCLSALKLGCLLNCKLLSFRIYFGWPISYLWPMTRQSPHP